MTKPTQKQPQKPTKGNAPGASSRDVRDPFGALTLSPKADANGNALQLSADESARDTGMKSTLRWLRERTSSAARDAFDADRALQRAMAAAIEVAKARYPLDAGAQWRPGEPLRLLLSGYTGTRNTGADVRVEEMIRQFRHLLGDDHLSLSILTIDPERSRNYFRTARQLHLPKLFPKFLFETVHEQHGVVACEGSMFKSKFANALATMMVGSLGLALAEHKLAVGYGGEAGKMDPELETMVRTYCEGAFIIARNAQSVNVLSRLGIESRPGTDTAWTFSPRSPEQGHALLRNAGWDGEKPVLAVAPINPYFWPVRPDLRRGALHALTGAHKDAHYASVYFHNAGPEVERNQQRYVRALADGVRRFREHQDCFVVGIGMEMLDRGACEQFASEFGAAAPIFVSDDHDMHAMVSILRQATYLLSSRYHAVVTSMSAGVLSVGVTMDERIRNLMDDRGQPELCMHVDDPELASNIARALGQVARDPDGTRNEIAACVARNLLRMGSMGMEFVDYIRARHPEFPMNAEFGTHGDPRAHLPPLSADLQQLLDANAATSRHSRTKPTERTVQSSARDQGRGELRV